MPKEYTSCVKGYVNKGKPLKDAKRICAINYFKKHGKRPQDVHSSYENALFTVLEVIFNSKLMEE
jgi:hypothetical protein